MSPSLEGTGECMRREIVPYKSYLKQYARNLRNKGTKSERILWSYLRRRQVMGYKFMRQRPLLWYIADFYAYELNLVIEVDGYSHNFKEVQEKDQRKERALERIGIKVIRFQDHEVFSEIDNVLAELEGYIRWYEQTYGLSPPKSQTR